MITGLCISVVGVLILLYPKILVFMISSTLIMFGLGMMTASWQFRRLRRSSESRFINWITRW